MGSRGEAARPTLTKATFISLEGCDGVGKSTQFERLCRALLDLGWPVEAVREPGGTEIGERIRTIILDPANQEMASTAEALLYAASRAQLVAEKIQPALARGGLVLADRYVDSSLVYQGHALGLGRREVASINRFATGGLLPDLTLLLDADPNQGLVQLKSARPQDRIERRAQAYRQQVREGYLELAREDPGRFRVIRADRPIDEVHWDLLQTVLDFIKNR
ncbi:MAG TPA: dTMP kinase [Bacillota bacterium]